ncbi:LpxI family protein [Candidatus Dependentiae bacterium]
MIAIIAGTGNLPQRACSKLLEKNKPFFVISLFPEDNSSEIKQIIPNNIELFAKKFYKPSKIIKLIKSKKTTQVLFIGKVDKQNLLNKIKLDFLAIKLLAQLSYKNDKDIMEILISYLKKEGLQVIKQSDILGSLFIEPGVLTGTIDIKMRNDINFGMQKATQLSQCDIGQTVIIKDQMIIAVEAIEGTNECIKRGIQLGKKDLIICKTAHIKHNTKYDLPTLGLKTLHGITKGQIQAIAWKSNKTFISSKENFIRKAKELNISLISVGDKL